MATEVRWRRGTAEEHENFTGANGEITVDTTNKTLRVHDGETPGGNRVVDESRIGTGDDEVPTNSDLGSAAYEDDTRYAHRSNNLSDLDDASAGRDNLGLGSASERDTGTAPDEVPTNAQIAPVADDDTASGYRLVFVDGYLATEEISE